MTLYKTNRVCYSEVNDCVQTLSAKSICSTVPVGACTYTKFLPFPHTFHPTAVKSFVEMARFILRPGVERLSLLSERISQDHLENYFGKQRARGGRCDNPTLKESLQNAVAIRAQRSLELDRVQGNCR